MGATIEQAVTKVMNILPPRAIETGQLANSSIRSFVAEEGPDKILTRETDLIRRDLEKRFGISFAVATAPVIDGANSRQKNNAVPAAKVGNKPISNGKLLPSSSATAAVVHTTRDPYDDSFVNDAEDYGQAAVPDDVLIEAEFDSDDEEFFDESNADIKKVFNFLQNATQKELVAIDGISVKKAEIIMSGRPFEKWQQCLEFMEAKFPRMAISDVANSVKNFLNSRTIVWKVIRQCRTWGKRMERALHDIDKVGGLMKQPAIMSKTMHMKHYQLKGLTWMVKLREHGINGILADEMGLGKTVQAISFIVHELDLQTRLDSRVPNQYPYLVVVPSSTIDNWIDEFRNWAPHIRVLRYHGNAGDRNEMAAKIFTTWNNFSKRPFDVILTTYQTATASQLDRALFKRIKLHAAFFDEGHLLKNMNSKRHQQLASVQADCRILLSGTPIQNNLLELLSVLAFAVPQVFQAGEVEAFQNAFQLISKAFSDNKTDDRNSVSESAGSSEQTPQPQTLYEQRKIREARQILKPFILRRTKEDVLSELPPKIDTVVRCPMTERQRSLYDFLIEEARRTRKPTSSGEMGLTLLMNLRKAGNHPLLMRHMFTDARLELIAADLIKYHTQCMHSEHRLVVEDLAVLNDYEIQRYIMMDGPRTAQKLQPYLYDQSQELFNSGKFAQLDVLLPQLAAGRHLVLLFSQFVMMLDILQEYMLARKINFKRMDGQTPIEDRQKLINEYNNDADCFVFLLSTRTAGLGINLTGADTVIIHDIDFNPYNDRQAENRVHRVGQLRDVTVYKLISENSVEERMLDIAKQKEHLEREVVLSLKNGGEKHAAHANGSSSSQAITVDDDDGDDEDDEVVGGSKRKRRNNKGTSSVSTGKAKNRRINTDDDDSSGIASTQGTENELLAVSQDVVAELLSDIIDPNLVAATEAV